VGKRNWCLDGSIQSKIIAMAFAIAAEIERDLISQRTKEALAARKQQGKTLGRSKGVGKSKLDKYRTEIEALLKNGSTKTWIANHYHSSPSNLTRWMQQRGIEG
jgi:DNA invertase Pin-like site-specific DNA recombinase